MSHLFRKTALRSNIQRAMFSLSLVGVLPVMAVTAPAWAQSASQEQDYEIAAGPLGTALSQFAAASGVTLSFGSAQTEGRHTQGIHGRYSFAHGIAQLLAGSGLQVQREGEGRYSLIAVPQTGALELGPTSIKGWARPPRIPGPTPRGRSVSAARLPRRCERSRNRCRC